MKTEIGTVYIAKRFIESIGVALLEVGVSVEDYNSGAFILFHGGGYDGFSHQDGEACLEVIGHVNGVKPFQNVMQLDRDYRAGVYAGPLGQADALAREMGL